MKLRCIPPLLLLLLGWVQPLRAATLEILYELRPPFIAQEGESLRGLVATPLIAALKQSALAYTLTEKPSKRHLHEIRANLAPLCAMGWFKNAEREQFGRYTRAVYTDKPMAVLTRSDQSAVRSKRSIDELLQDSALTLLAKSSYSYGDFIDSALNRYGVQRREVSADNSTMITLIEKKRADYLFISQEEAADLLTDHPQAAHLTVQALEGMPAGNARYLICSQQVEPAVIDRLNAHLP